MKTSNLNVVAVKSSNYIRMQARTQDFEKGGSEYRVALGHGEGVGGGSCAKREAFTL